MMSIGCALRLSPHFIRILLQLYDCIPKTLHFADKVREQQCAGSRRLSVRLSRMPVGLSVHNKHKRKDT